MHVTDFNEIK